MRILAFVVFFTVVAPKLAAQPDNEVRITNLERVDEIYLDHKRELISDLSFKRLDKILYGDKRDLSVLQQLLNQQIVAAANAEELLAMGVALGDVYVKEHQMTWQVYEDNRGKSRAVCLPRINQCLFPVTMISKRVKRNVKVDINSVYNNGFNLIKDYIPKLPYSVKK